MASTENGSRRSELQLTRKERDLLELLESNPGRCFSRPYLLRTIWGYSDDTKTRTVDVHVSRLRKKLEGRRDVTIHTVVRQGYILQSSSDRVPQLDAGLTPLNDAYSAGAPSAFSAVG